MDYLSKIAQVYQKMLAENMFLSEGKINECYETFRIHFSPEKLKSLDGEALLHTLFNHSNKGSLVYWLEFKNDDELPTNKFGGIAGGSAIKFGIYRRKEDGKWITGRSRDMKETPVEQAVAIAREKRDLLVRGAEIIASMPDNYDDNTYVKLQQDLTEELGTLGDTAWVHKYYHMLFPNRIGDFHAPNFQRFYLIKLLEMPIKEDGRYALEGQYLRMAKGLSMPLQHFTDVIYEMFGPVHSYWRIGTRTSDGDKSYWDDMKGNGYVSVGWPDLGDLDRLDYSTDTKAREQLKDLLNQYYLNDQRITGKRAYQLLLFARYVKPQDVIVAADGQNVLGIGKVTGKYEYQNGLDFPHIIKVQWLSTDQFKLPNVQEGLRTTVNMYKDYNNLVTIEQKLSNLYDQPFDSSNTTPLISLTGIIGQIESILERKKQVILYGPPGTGKTYWAEKACLELAARKVFGRSFDSLSDDEKIHMKGGGQGNGLVRMCCFHPSYGYEDFIEGIKPSVSNGQTVFSLNPGIFKSLCDDAKNKPDKNFYLIIDEINRGDISRIFGELITIIEAGKRGKQMLLPISGELFSVPENLFIVGTMNTADRSIALLDVALRRRFGFIELMPDISLLGDVAIEGLPVGLWLMELNRRICEYVGRDARNLQIGHSYFMENGRVINNFDKLRKIIQEDILPLLEEYCYGDYITIAKIIGDGLVDSTNQLIRYDLLKPSKKAELISVLLATCPDITTSSMVQVDEHETESNLENDESTEDSES